MSQNPHGALEVVAAIIEAGGLVLACRRLPGKSAGGKWEFPGGKVEAGESLAAALRREIREELGVEIAVKHQVRTDDTAVGSTVIRLTCFAAVLAGDPPTASTDHDELLWIPKPDLLALDWAAPDLPAVRQVVGGGSAS